MPIPQIALEDRATFEGLKLAQNHAHTLFNAVEASGILSTGVSEAEISQKAYELAEELFGIKKYWHKRVVRAGKNTLAPYRLNPPNTALEADDILFLDFGPIFEAWEADFGRTYVLGNDPRKLKVKQDIETAFQLGKQFFMANLGTITGSQLYDYMYQLATDFGWTYGGPHAGHLVGKFPHERLLGDEVDQYIHPDNHELMLNPDKNGNFRHWILEVHFIDEQLGFGGFFEQLLTDELFLEKGIAQP